MPLITYVTHHGTAHTADVPSGKTLMEAAVKIGLEGIDAECGGCCTCATCRIDVDPAWAERVKPPFPEELEMLQFAPGTGPRSRLACQVRVSDELDGLIVHVPETQATL
jgi:2Fe-2S ferredoxin